MPRTSNCSPASVSRIPSRSRGNAVKLIFHLKLLSKARHFTAEIHLHFLISNTPNRCEDVRLCRTALHPPFSFRSCRKENAPCTVEKKKCYPNLHSGTSLGNTVLNCSAQIIVFPYIARAQCIQTPNLYPVPTEYQILCCKQDTLFSSFRCRWYTFAENNFVLEPSSA